MFKLFNKKQHKTKLLATAESVAGLEDYYEEHKSEFAEFEAALQPLSSEKSKAKFIIKEIYARHGIDTGPSWIIYDNCLDSEAFTDLCTFNDNELASLRKWTQRYKDLETEIIKLGEKFRNSYLHSNPEMANYLKETK